MAVYLPSAPTGTCKTIFSILYTSCKSTFHQLGCWFRAVLVKLFWSPSTALSAVYKLLLWVQVLLCVAGLLKATLLEPEMKLIEF